jgi:hypothetical protein
MASLAVAGVCAAAISGCGDLKFEQDYLEPSNNEREAPRYTSEGPRQTVFGNDGFNFLDTFGSDKKSGAGGAGIGVNSFLWRASLDTVSFMPLTSADPFGGVIITDWYTPPEAPSERFKMNIYILGRQLRADGLRVAVFRQEQAGGGGWINASVKTETSINLENQILTRARQLRVAAATTK